MKLLQLKSFLFLVILGLMIDIFDEGFVRFLNLTNSCLIEQLIDQGVIFLIMALLILALLKEKNLQTKFEKIEEPYRKVVEHSPNGIVIHKFGIIKYVNPVGVKILGAETMEELIGKDFLNFIPPYDHENIKKAWNTIQKNKKPIGFITVKWFRADNQAIDVEVMGMPITISGKQFIQQFFRDVTEQKKAQELIHQMAYQDQLTRLPNRQLFEDNVNKALRDVQKNKKKLAVMFLDLDGFKRVNDTFGHETGDLLLKEVAKRLVTCICANDTVSRFAGDEFMILLPEVYKEDEDVIEVAKRIVKSMEASFIINDNEIKVTTSIGISINTSGVVNAKELVKQADIAMYTAKKRGKNNYHVYQTVDKI